MAENVCDYNLYEYYYRMIEELRSLTDALDLSVSLLFKDENDISLVINPGTDNKSYILDIKGIDNKEHLKASILGYAFTSNKYVRRTKAYSDLLEHQDDSRCYENITLPEEDECLDEVEDESCSDGTLEKPIVDEEDKKWDFCTYKHRMFVRMLNNYFESNYGALRCDGTLLCLYSEDVSQTLHLRSELSFDRHLSKRQIDEIESFIRDYLSKWFRAVEFSHHIRYRCSLLWVDCSESPIDYTTLGDYYIPLEPYEERLLNEYDELEDRIIKLSKFLNNNEKVGLTCPLSTLEDQIRYMRGYKSTLKSRIKLLEGKYNRPLI